MTELAVYLRQFAHLRRAPGAIWTDVTKKQAPHKPILLLAILAELVNEDETLSLNI